MSTGIDIRADVYHVGHHGSKTSSDETFVDAIHPTSVVISCGIDNEYGHPHAGPMNLFRQKGMKVYRTDEDGTIIAASSGNGITFDIPASETWQAGEPIGSAQELESELENNNVAETTYVLNTNTMKFHLFSCSSVTKMSEKNRKDSELSREEIINAGYEACSICNP